ncbi:DNA replication/repair protein RecF [Sphingomonas sp.]|uniref:DNA replication/repair protein RecF n=1 Tax=Sphingomonas sp. TaxID=28214 RepID=UPI000DB6E3C2|nr:DNA replication/repair protein RecF [Sphingomonas sp.]PZU12028.1 MAG: DNA replication/repair protein RecF [Sphingomonas sp.]
MTALARLTLTDFRNHAALTLTPDAGLVLLTGLNGSGKTNILEAVSLLAPGRGLRGATLSEMARSNGPGGFAISARTGDDHDLGTATLAAAPERRQVRINGANGSAATLGDYLAILWVTPAMDRIFLEGASARRRFLDRLVLAREPAHASHASRYETAMRARNKLLAEPDGADPGWLAALEAGMAEHGNAMAAARTRTVKRLSERLEAQSEGPFARAGLSLDGWQPSGEEGAAALAAELRAGRGRDAAAGRTLAGPHRSDLAVIHLGKGQPAALCSTGEQKALLLGIVLAHADLVAEDRRTRPILLMDEVAAHLDPLRRAALLARLADAGGQVWMTGTDLVAFGPLPTPATIIELGDPSPEPPQ